jgi:hypothetical protein
MRRREFCFDLADLERYPSGQREQTVNLSADAFEGSNPSLSIDSVGGSLFMVHGKTQMVGGGLPTMNYELPTNTAGVTQLVESPALGGMVTG